ncbi:MAG: cyclic nucleotide-binding domain-containing protein [bacterium]|nr:cyclic nucleotide-binding domain-containing protein [bacterium]
MDTREILGSTPFFAEVLDEAGLDALASSVRGVTFEQGETIFREGDAGSNMYVIVGGSVSVSINLPIGDHRTATLNAGDLVGEMSLLTGSHRVATVIAKTSVELIEITEAAMKMMLGAGPSIIDRLAVILEHRQNEVDWIYRSVNWENYSFPSTDMASVIRKKLLSSDNGPN